MKYNHIKTNKSKNKENNNSGMKTDVVGSQLDGTIGETGVSKNPSGMNQHFNLIDENELEEANDPDEYDYIESIGAESGAAQNDTFRPPHQGSKSSNKLMPHEKNAINFLINEYLLEQSYKMTSITFAEENESQDLEDWDVIGLNRAKPPNLLELYRYFLNRGNKKDVDDSNKKKTKKIEITTSEHETQVEIETHSVETNTSQVEFRSVESHVNFDRETFENQKMQINKLLEKQEILIKSLAKLESEISILNTERESSLKKIDLL